MVLLILSALCCVFGFLRFILPVSGKLNKADIFKDFAHIFVGLLAGVAIYQPMVWWLFGGLTALEVVAFVVRKKKDDKEDPVEPSWLSDERINQIKQGDDATRGEVLAALGELRYQRRRVR